MNKNQKKLSIVVPCYNEESNLSLTYNEIIKSLKKTKINRYEIIFVDDYSTDRTQNGIKKILKQNKNTKIIVNKKNLGLGQLFSRVIKL